MSLLLLTTLADVKQLFAEQQTTVGPDALLTLMIPAVSALRAAADPGRRAGHRAR